MSKWVKAQSQETIALLILMVLFAGIGGFIMLRQSADEPGVPTEKKGFFEWLFHIEVTIPESDGDDSTPPPFIPPIVPPDDITVPTSLTCSVIYPVLVMGEYQIGTVSSNGRNYPVTIYARHKGLDEVATIAGFLNEDGMWTSPPELMGTPGYWEFWAQLDTGVTSDPIEATVEGIKVIGQGGHYSKTMSDSFELKVVSNHINTNAEIVGHYPSGGYSQPITSCAINSFGFGSVAPSLDFLANGDWEIDAIIGSDYARSYYYGSHWVDVGR